MSTSMTLADFLAERLPNKKFSAEELAAINAYEATQKFSGVVESIKKWRPAEDHPDVDLSPADFILQVWTLAETLTAMVKPNENLSRGKAQTMIGFDLDGKTVQVRVYETPDAS